MGWALWAGAYGLNLWAGAYELGLMGWGLWFGAYGLWIVAISMKNDGLPMCFFELGGIQWDTWIERKISLVTVGSGGLGVRGP